MKRLVEIVIWLSLCLFFWAGITLVQPFKSTKTGRKFINFIDDVDLFAFEVREWGLVSACKAWRRWNGR